MQFHQNYIEKYGNKQHMYYQNNDNHVYKELDDDSFRNYFRQFRPNIDFSLPDKLIQSFVKWNHVTNI